MSAPLPPLPIEDQLELVRAYALRDGWVVVGVYHDAARHRAAGTDRTKERDGEADS